MAGTIRRVGGLARTFRRDSGQSLPLRHHRGAQPEGGARETADGVNHLRSKDRAILVITHHQRLLDHLVPDRVHVLSQGRIIRSGGPELARHLAEVRPGLPVVFMTGYSDYPIVNEHGDYRIANRRVIMKPFRQGQLRSFVREALDERPQAMARSA